MKVKTRHWKRRAVRIAVVLLLPLASLFLLRLVWGWEAAQRLQATQARLRAAGVRLDAGVRQVAPERNAVEALKQAVAAIRLSHADIALLSDGDGNPSFADITWTETHKPDVKRLLAEQADVFKHLRDAAARPDVYWADSAGAVDLSPSHPIYGIRLLANLLVDDALVAYDEKREGDALEDLCLVLELARIEDADLSEVGHVMACSIRSVLAHAVERLAPALKLQEADGSAPAARRLLALLAEVPRGDHQSLGFENSIGRIEATPKAGMQPFWKWWFEPLWQDESARVQTNMAQCVAAVRAGNWQKSHRLTPAWRIKPTSILQESAFAISLRARYTETYIRSHFRSCADCGAAELLLAARLYAMEHGTVPAARESLVPRYLSKLPVDPFAGDGRPMQYRVDGDGVTVWSVGENGTDEGGHVMLRDGRRVMRYGGSSDPRRNPPDLVYGDAWRQAPTGEPPVGPGVFVVPATATRP